MFGQEEIEAFVLFSLSNSRAVRRCESGQIGGYRAIGRLGVNGCIEGAEEGCFYSFYWVAEGCCAFLSKHLLPAEVGCFAGFGLGDGVGVLVSSFLGYC